MKCEYCNIDVMVKHSKYNSFIWCPSCFENYSNYQQLCCSNKNPKTYYKTLRNGVKQYRNYCSNCGSPHGPVLKHSTGKRQCVGELNGQADSYNEKIKNIRVFYNWLKEQQAKHKMKFHDKYLNYLNTQAWKEKRKKVLVRDNYICQSCLKNKAIDIHHMTYKNIYKEPLFDLVSVCKDCHKKIHYHINDITNFNY